MDRKVNMYQWMTIVKKFHKIYDQLLLVPILHKKELTFWRMGSPSSVS
jgi:hypothetical protein